jgi:hypothetical protein
LEAQVLGIELLKSEGAFQQAKRKAEEFQRTHPRSPYLGRLRGLLDDSPQDHEEKWRAP